MDRISGNSGHDTRSNAGAGRDHDADTSTDRTGDGNTDTDRDAEHDHSNSDANQESHDRMASWQWRRIIEAQHTTRTDPGDGDSRTCGAWAGRTLDAQEAMSMTIDDRDLIKRISSNNVRAQQAEQEGDPRRELQAHLWVLQDIARLLIWVNTGSSEINDNTAMSYAESACYTTRRVRELVAWRVER
jgi:hypothetical protein